MSRKKSGQNLSDINDIYGAFFSGLTAIIDENQTTKILSIDEFIQSEVNLGIELTPLQLIIPKLFYGVPLSEEEYSIVEYWMAKNRIVWDLQEKNHQIMVLEAGRRSGKCKNITGLVFQGSGLLYLHEILQDERSIKRNSFSPTDFGLETQLEIAKDLNLEPDTEYLIDSQVAIEGKSKTARARGFYSKGVSDTKKIKTHCGYTLEGTPEHRIKVIDIQGNIIWRYLGDIQPGERACIHRNTDLFPELEYKTNQLPDRSFKAYSKSFSKPDTINADWGYLIGALTADGSWTVAGKVEITNHVDDIYIYEQAFKNCNIETETKPDSNPKRASKAYRVVHYGVQLRTFLDDLGWILSSAPSTKLTPWVIRRSPRHVQAAYLSGLFDGDGSVESNGKSITFSTASKQLSIETQLLLLNFGIVCHRKEKIVKDKPYYIIRLRGQTSVRRFISEIGFRLDRKQDQVIANLNKTKHDGGDTEKIPNQIEWLKRLRNCLPSSMGKQPGSRKGRWGDKLSTAVLEKPKLRNLREEFRAIVGNAIKESSDEEFSGYRLQSLVEFARKHCQADQEAVEHFEHLLECDYFYDEIESVKDSEAFCVDLSVPGHEQYVSQGFTNHNTLLSALIGAYEFYKLCRIPNPQKFYNIAYSTPISILVLATSAKQGKQTIFGNILGIINNSPFFKKLQQSGELFIGREEIRLDSKLIGIYAGNSQSSSQVGGTLKAFIMDEFARFSEGKEGQDSQAMELWSNLGISASPFKENAVRIAISSAWEEGDPIQQLQKDIEGDPNAISFRFCSWHMNPIGAGRDNPVVVSEYRRDPIAAALEFEGIRPQVASSFFRASEVEYCFRGESAIAVNPQIINVTESGKELTGLEIIRLDRCNHSSILALDPAIKLDGYAGAFGHNAFDEEGRQIVIVDGILLWEPEPHRPVSFQNVQDVILDIHKQRPLCEVVTDHHGSSAETTQRLEIMGIRTRIEYFSNRTQLEMYDMTRKLMHEERLILPFDFDFKPLTIRELTRVMLTKKGRIDHPSYVGESKDIADAIVSLVYALTRRLPDDMYGSFTPTVTGSANGKSTTFPTMGAPDLSGYARPSARSEFQQSPGLQSRRPSLFQSRD